MENRKGGLYVKRLREQKNLSQRQMGKIVGKRNERICEWESDVFAIKLIDFLEMAEKLGVKNFNKILKSE